MRKLICFLGVFYGLLLYSQETESCKDPTYPYWANGINSRVKGENPVLRKAFEDVQNSEKEIEPRNGFITLRLIVSKTGELCEIQSFEIDENYQKTAFNNGELVKELKNIAATLNDWERDREFQTYNLIRIKIEDGELVEIF